MSQQIKIKESFVTVDARISQWIAVVEISEQYIASGRFGFIYECISVNGKQPSPALYIKLLKVNKEAGAVAGYSTILKLQQRINAIFQKYSGGAHKTLAMLPALKAFPGFSFQGELDGREVWGYSMANLFSLGFSSLEDVFNGMRLEEENFKSLSFHKKLQFCFHLAKGFDLLSGVNYVHADVNPKNIFINMTSGELAIIDYDGGGILDQPRDDTLTHGKLEDGEWLAPEIYEKLEANQDLKVDKYCDRWSVSVAFHYLLFGCDPYFFIKEQSKKCREDYLRNNKFYPINLEDENISVNAAYFIEPYENTIKTNVPDFIHHELIKNYQEGFFKPLQRTPYSEWVELFKQTQSPPVIHYFKGSKDFALKGTQIKLSWKVEDAIELTIDNQIGDVTGKNEITVRPDQSMTYCLRSRGHFGEAERSTEVNVFPVPVLEYLKVPMPDFGPSVTLPEIAIEFPAINLSIQLKKNIFTETPTDFIPLSDELINMQPLYRKKSSFWSISHVFKKIKQAIIST